MNVEVQNNIAKHIMRYKECLHNYGADVRDFPNENIQNYIDMKSEGLDFCDKNILLKDKLTEYLNGSYENYDVNFWIINTWGQIPFKKDAEHQKRIVDFGERLNKKEIKFRVNAMPSLSKVSSFVDSQKYFVYDSRAVFALNWLLYVSGEKDRYFYQPPSRGGISPYAINDLIENQCGIIIPRFVSIGMYLEYCDLINKLYDIVYKEDKNRQPYKLEMLLFTIAVDEIITEIEKYGIRDTKYYHPKSSTKTKKKAKSSKNGVVKQTGVITKYQTFCKKAIQNKKNDYWDVQNSIPLGIRTNIFAKTLKYDSKVAYQSFSITGYRDYLNKDHLLRLLEKEFSDENSSVYFVDKENNKFLTIVNKDQRCLKNSCLDETVLNAWFKKHVDNLIKIIDGNK